MNAKSQPQKLHHLIRSTAQTDVKPIDVQRHWFNELPQSDRDQIIVAAFENAHPTNGEKRAAADTYWYWKTQKGASNGASKKSGQPRKDTGK